MRARFEVANELVLAVDHELTSRRNVEEAQFAAGLHLDEQVGAIDRHHIAGHLRGRVARRPHRFLARRRGLRLEGRAEADDGDEPQNCGSNCHLLSPFTTLWDGRGKDYES